MRNTRFLPSCALLLFGVVFSQTGEGITPPMGPEVKIVLATLAPKSSADGKALSRMVPQLFKESGQSIKVQIFYGGQMGDEAEAVEKILARQIDGAAFTGNGLGRISGDSRVLEIPGLFRTPSEAEYVYPRIEGDINDLYEKKGFHLVALVEVGYAYFFSKKAINNIESVRKTKCWVWKGDQLANELMGELKIPAVPVNMTEVNSALQTGLLDAFYATPALAAAVQWNNQVTTLLEMPITMVSGGLVTSLEAWRRLNEAQRKLFTRVARNRMGDLTRENRRNNAETIRLFKQNGMSVVPSTDRADAMEQVGYAMESRLSGKLFPAELAARARELVSEYRQKNSGGKK
jgi:TRAP-type C4-dicarboxylate transport system substrate-binding protein